MKDERAVLSHQGRKTSSRPQNSNSNKYGHGALLLRPKRQTGSHVWPPTGLLAAGAGQGLGGNTHKVDADGEGTLAFRAVT